MTAHDGMLPERLRHGKRSVDVLVPDRTRRKAISVAKVAIQEAAPPRTAKKASRKRQPDPAPTARLATHRERTHHDWTGDIPAYVQTTDQVRRVLTRAKARTGSHVASFVRDYETAGSDLRSPGLEMGSGANGLPLPLNKIQAIDRLRDFERLNPRAFGVCEAVLVFGAKPADIVRKGVNHNTVSTMIQDSVEALAGFYTPNRRRPDKRLAAFAKFVEEAKRVAKI